MPRRLRPTLSAYDPCPPSRQSCTSKDVRTDDLNAGSVRVADLPCQVLLHDSSSDRFGKLRRSEGQPDERQLRAVRVDLQ